MDNKQIIISRDLLEELLDDAIETLNTMTVKNWGQDLLNMQRRIVADTLALLDGGKTSPP